MCACPCARVSGVCVCVRACMCAEGCLALPYSVTPPLKNVRKRRFRKTAPKKVLPVNEWGAGSRNADCGLLGLNRMLCDLACHMDVM